MVIVEAIAEKMGCSVEWLLTGSNPAAHAAIQTTLDNPAPVPREKFNPTPGWFERMDAEIKRQRPVIEYLVNDGKSVADALAAALGPFVEEEKKQVKP